MSKCKHVYPSTFGLRDDFYIIQCGHQSNPNVTRPMITPGINQIGFSVGKVACTSPLFPY